MTPHSGLRVIHVLRRMVFLLPILLFGCDEPERFPPNQWWTVDSYVQPDPMIRDNVVWVAQAKTGEGHWTFYPHQVSTFIDQVTESQWGRIDAATLMIEGRRWELSTKNHRNWTIVPPWEETAAERSNRMDTPIIALIIVVIAAAGIIGSVVAYENGKTAGGTEFEAKIRAEVRREHASREQAIRYREAEWNGVQATNARKQEQAERKLKEAQEAFDARVAEHEEEQQRRLQAIKNAESMLQRSADIAGGTSQYLRTQHLQGELFGDLFAVTYLADRSGFIRLAWKVQSDRPQPPTLRVVRDGKLIHSEPNMTGEHADQIVPGRRYQYYVELQDDRQRTLGRGATFEVKIPTARVWNGGDDGDQSDRERKIREQFKARFNGVRVTEELKAEYYAEVKAKGYPPEMEEWLLIKIDALAAELWADS